MKYSNANMISLSHLGSPVKGGFLPNPFQITKNKHTFAHITTLTPT